MSKNLQDILEHAKKWSHCLHPKVKLRLVHFLESIGHDREVDEVEHFLSDTDLPAVFCVFLVVKNGFPQCGLHDSALALCTNWDTMESQEAAGRAAAVCGTSSLICVLTAFPQSTLSNCLFIQQSFLPLYSIFIHLGAGKLNQSRELLPEFFVKDIGQKSPVQERPKVQFKPPVNFTCVVLPGSKFRIFFVVANNPLTKLTFYTHWLFQMLAMTTGPSWSCVWK